MSYILDALRKADAQRERSRAPGLHDQPVQPAGADVSPAWRRSPLLWGAIGIGVLSVVLVAWQMAQPASMPSVPSERVALASSPSEPASTPPEPAPATEVVPPPPEPRPVAPARSQAAVAPAPAASRTSAAPPGGTASAAAPAVAASAAAPAPAAGEPGPMPAGAPRLAISGGVYSQNPAQRMLIVGGQVFNEGSEVAPGVRLEQVRPHQAVLSWRGQRYAVSF